MKFEQGLFGGLIAGAVLGYFASGCTQPKTTKKTSCCSGSKPTFKLSYWPGRGLAEITRVMFTVAGVEFEDERSGDRATWLSYKENCGRPPLLFVTDSGKTIRVGQSKSIRNFVARELKMDGKNRTERAIIQTIIGHCEEMLQTFGKDICPYGESVDEEKMNMWFNMPGVHSAERENRYFRWYMMYIEELCGSDGFVVGDSFTVADALIWITLRDVCTDLPEKLYNGQPGSYMSYPFRAANLETTTNILQADFPKVYKIVENFNSCPAMEKYLAARGTQMF